MFNFVLIKKSGKYTLFGILPFCLPEEAPSGDEETPHGNLQKCFEPKKI